MNFEMWSDPQVAVSLVALKLCEEAAEVGNEITDPIMRGKKVSKKRLREEIEHVEFLCAVLRERYSLPDRGR